MGATGLIGSHLLPLLLEHEQYQQVIILTRRPLQVNHPKADVRMVDFDHPEEIEEAMVGSNHVYCAVGTTRRKDPKPETYRKVDYDIPVNAALAAEKLGTSHFILISSVGANSTSKNFYLKLKGEVEDKVRSLAIPHVEILQPSLLLGKRNEFRLGERIAQVLAPLYTFLMPTQYKPIAASEVALSMLDKCLNNHP